FLLLLLHHELNSIALGVALALLVLICFFSYIFQAFNFHYLPEPSVCLICGMLVGFAIRYNAFNIPYQEHIMSCDVKLVNDSFPEILVIHNKNETHEYSYEGKHKNGHKTKKDILSSKILFDPEIFFHLILPPIIFNIGFKLQKRYFFRNFGTILTISLAGTALTLFLFGILIFLYSLMNKYAKEIGFNFAQSIMFGVIICSTDPVSVLAVFSRLGVDVDLYSIILGESALNDAVSLIAQRAVTIYFLCYCLNFRRRRKITTAFQHILFFSGILLPQQILGLKGALAFALALEDISTPVRQVMLTTTVVLVLITVLLFGGLIGKLAALLKIPLHRDGGIPIDFEDENIEIDHLYSDESFLTVKFRQIDEKAIIQINIHKNFK
ncbi:hypothetical protein MXB_3262, partial [Myxobolus squamalis]